jgi:uncharacterized membrane protein YkoI
MKSQGRVRWTSIATLVVLTVGPAPWAAAQSRNADKKAKLPPAVAKAIEANRPGAEIEKLDVEKEQGLAFYDVEFKAGQGEMDVAADGTVLDVATIVEMKDLPPAVAAVIQKAARGTTVKQLSRSEVRARIEKVDGRVRVSTLATPEYVYEAEFAKGGEIEVAADGTILKGPKGAANP